MSDRRPEKRLHVHEIEGGFILHEDHDLGEGAEALDPIPFEGHQHLMALIARNFVNEISGPAESVRRGVESGTIKGEVEWRCGNPAGHEDGWFCDPAVPSDQLGPKCGFRLVLGPLGEGSDG